MKTYKMKLLPQYFNYIKNGTKRLELRLNDEKRKDLEINDIIIFEKLSEDIEYLNSKVKKIYKYKNFDDLINDFDIEVIGDKSITKEELLHTLNEIYTTEQQDKILAFDNEEEFLKENFGGTPMVLLMKNSKIVDTWIGYAEYSEYSAWLEKNGFAKK